MITNFNCYKNEDKKEGQPDYKLSAKIGEKWEEIGAGWVKDGKAGKYISFSLRKPYNDRSGLQIVPVPTANEVYDSVSKDAPNPDEISF